MANQRVERVPLPQAPRGSVPQAGVQGLPMLSARGLARAASQSDGSAEVFKAASDVFGRVATSIGQMADDAAQHEGAEAGALAGLDLEFRPKGDRTIYGAAFDQAGLETFKSKMAVDVAAQMQAAADKHQADPNGLAEALASIKAGWQETVDDPGLAPHVKPTFEAQFARNQVGLMREATRQHHAAVRADQEAALEADREMRARTAEQQAFRLGLDPTADEVLAGELADMRQRLAVRGIDGKPLVNPENQVKLLRSTETGMARSRIFGAFSRLPDLQSKVRFIQELETRYQAGGDRVLDLFAPEEYQAVVNTLAADARQGELGAAQAARELKADLKAFGDAAKQGIALNDAELSGLKARVATSGDDEVIKTFNEAIDTLGEVRRLNMMPPAAIEAEVDAESARLLAEDASLKNRDVARLELKRDYLKNAHTELAGDQLGFAAKTGTARVDPIDLRDPGSLARRVSAAEHVSEVYAREIKFFRPEEKEALAAISRKGGDEMLAVSAAIVSGMGPHAPKALAEIAESAPAIAVAGGLWVASGGREAPAVARDMAKGLELRAKKGFVSQSQTADVKTAANDVLQGVLARQPTDQAALINATNAVYDARAYQQGVVGFDAELYKSSMREVLGERRIDGRTFGGIAFQGSWWSSQHPVVLPPSVRQDALDDVLSMVDAGDLDRTGHLRPVGATGAPIAVARIREGTLVQVGTGQYAVAMGDPETPGQERWLKINAAGDPFILDLGRLAPELARRRPDLFFGVR